MNAIQIKMTEVAKINPKLFPDDIWREIKSYITTGYYERKLNELKPKIKEFITQT